MRRESRNRGRLRVCLAISVHVFLAVVAAVERDRLPFQVLLALHPSQASLLGVWIVLGRSGLFFRVITAVGACAFLAAMNGKAIDSVFLTLIPFSGTAITLTTGNMFRRSFQKLASKRQFTLLHLLSAVTIVAIACSVVNLHDLAADLIIYDMGFILVSVTAVVFAYTSGKNLWHAGMLVFNIGIIALFVALSQQASADEALNTLLVLAFDFVITLATLSAVKSVFTPG